VQRSLDLFERQSGLPSLAYAVLGPHRHARLIAEMLADRCALRVELFDPAQRFHQSAADRATPLPPAALGVLGAALRVEESIAVGQWQARLRARLLPFWPKAA
jgi:Tfp pilus assembly PilM family ATPase